MPIKNFRFLQPRREGMTEFIDGNDQHQWRQVTLDASGLAGDSLDAFEYDNFSGVACRIDTLDSYCVRVLTEFTDEGFPIAPLPSEVNYCIVDNTYGCHDADIIHPETHGWIQVRACDALYLSCSQWSVPKPVSEVEMETGLALVILIVILGKALIESWQNK
tara:strand:+ start:1009 stop:1494 length:486 start_codon:yes stop_codon:yes gene_type:complete